MEHTIPYFRELVIFLLVAGLAVPLLNRVRVSPVLGYLLIGGIIGPYGLGLWVDEWNFLQHLVIYDIAGVNKLAELGVIFLLFMIGLELSLDRLWAMRRFVFGLGSLQILVSAAIIATWLWYLDTAPRAAIILGACLALSSTAIVMQLLTERRAVASPLGRTSFAILLMQDLAVVPILFLVGVLSAKAGGNITLSLAIAMGKAIAIIALIYSGGRLLVRPLFNMVARLHSTEMFMAATLLTIAAAAALTSAAGLSMALGAFLAGLLLAETEFRHQIEVDIEPFKGLLLGLFFMSVGMGIDYRIVADNFIWIITAVICLFIIKTSVTTLLCRLFGLPTHTAIETGLLTGQSGEFAFVVIGLMIELAMIPAALGQFLLIVAGLSMICTPFVASSAQKLAQRLEQKPENNNKPSTNDISEANALQGHVLIAGFGRIGCLLSRILDADTIPFIALDNSVFNVAEARQVGMPVYFGDAGRLDLLKKANAGEASLLVLTMDNPEAIEKAVKQAHSEWPALRIVARARDSRHAAHLMSLGASEVIQETLEAGLQLSDRVLSLVGTPEDVARRRIDAQREQEMSALRDIMS